MAEMDISRRQFGCCLALTTAAPAIVAGVLLSNDHAVAKDGPPADVSDVGDLVSLVRRRYGGDRLGELEIAEIAKDIKTDMIRGAILSQFPLANADEPGVVFSVYVSP